MSQHHGLILVASLVWVSQAFTASWHGISVTTSKFQLLAGGSGAEGITLKIAFDRQWGVADRSAEKSERFTSPESLDMVHRLRRESDGVLVGRATVENDNPSLTVRRVPLLERTAQPVRIILDSNLSLDAAQYTIFHDGLPTLVYHGIDLEQRKVRDYTTSEAVKLVGVPRDSSGRLHLEDVVHNLTTDQKMKHIMVEGGPAVAQCFLQHAFVDRAILVFANHVEFIDPQPSGMTTESFTNNGLECLGQAENEGGDLLQYWSRPNLPWPSDALQDWP